jgi:putative NADH-flavin reductase
MKLAIAGAGAMVGRDVVEAATRNGHETVSR